MASPGDRRSLRRQIEEDDDVIELGDKEHEDSGAGVSTFLQGAQPGPGFSRKRIPAAQQQVEEKTPAGSNLKMSPTLVTPSLKSLHVHAR